jgi:hypothetical protein
LPARVMAGMGEDLGPEEGDTLVLVVAKEN